MPMVLDEDRHISKFWNHFVLNKMVRWGFYLHYSSFQLLKLLSYKDENTIFYFSLYIAVSLNLKRPLHVSL